MGYNAPPSTGDGGLLYNVYHFPKQVVERGAWIFTVTTLSSFQDVAAFLKDVDAIDVLLNSILKSRRNRLTVCHMHVLLYLYQKPGCI